MAASTAKLSPSDSESDLHCSALLYAGTTSCQRRARFDSAGSAQVSAKPAATGPILHSAGRSESFHILSSSSCLNFRSRRDSLNYHRSSEPNSPDIVTEPAIAG